jgi:hypothetical protein
VAAILAPTAAFASEAPMIRAHSNDGLENLVREYFSDIPVMIEIARCESTYHQYGKGGKPLHGGTGTMIGLFQISEHLHRGIADNLGWDIDTPEGNMAYARYLYEKNGTWPWLDSKPCWNAPKSAARWKAATKELAQKPAVMTDAADAAGPSASTTPAASRDASIADIQVKLAELIAKIADLQSGEYVASATL